MQSRSEELGFDELNILQLAFRQFRCVLDLPSREPRLGGHSLRPEEEASAVELLGGKVVQSYHKLALVMVKASTKLGDKLEERVGRFEGAVSSTDTVLLEIDDGTVGVATPTMVRRRYRAFIADFSSIEAGEHFFFALRIVGCERVGKEIEAAAD